MNQAIPTPSEKIRLIVNGLNYKFIIENSLPDDIGESQYDFRHIPYEQWCDKMLAIFEDAPVDTVAQPKYAIKCNLDTYYKIKYKFTHWVQEEIRNAHF